MSKECKWICDLDCNFWDTECGDGFYITDGNPSENGFKFCPYCGGTIVEVKTEDEQ